MKVLVIDAVRDIAEAVATRFRAAGHKVTVYHTLKDARFEAESEPPPDLIVTDLSLKDSGTRHTAAWVKLRGLRTAVLVFSGFLHEAPDLANARGVRVIFKPASLDELVKTGARWSRLRALTKVDELLSTALRRVTDEIPVMR